MIHQMMQCYVDCSVLFFIFNLILVMDSSAQVEFQSESLATDPSPSHFFYHQSDYPRDCLEALSRCSSSNQSGDYAMKPDGLSEVFDVYCDSDRFTVIARRLDRLLGFNRSWEDYEPGFGFLSNEFWLGNRRLSYMLNQKAYQLRFDVTLNDGSDFFVTYDSFRISGASTNYKVISAGQYNETIVSCPSNMIKGSCTCQRSCAVPDTGARSSCHVTGSCVCPSGFLINDGHCIPQSECGCFMAGNEQTNVLEEGGIHISPNCTRRCSCAAVQLTCEEDFQCNSHASCAPSADGWNCSCHAGYEGDGTNCRAIAVDCQDIFDNNQTTSGLYYIHPEWSDDPLRVYCNMADGGGWMVFQRQDGSENFYRNWTDYKSGFSSPARGMWLGNDKLHGLTNQKEYELRIDMTDTNGNMYHALYNSFRISDETDKYRLLSVGTNSGNAGSDALAWHVNKQFSTHDEDNDGWSDFDCAEEHQGGWWFGEGARCSDVVTYYDYYHYCSSSYYRGYCNDRCHSSCDCRYYYYYYYSYWYCPFPNSESYCENFPVGSSCAHCVKSHLNANRGSSTTGRSIVWDGLDGHDCGIQYTEMKIRPVRS